MGATESSAQPPRHLFVIGLQRSGTTLLAKLLGEQNDFSSFENTGVYMDEGQYLQSVFPVRGRLGYYSFLPSAHLTDASPINTAENAERLRQEWGAYWDHDKRVLVEKSPGNILRTRLLQAFFPDSAFLLIHRHPVAHAMAIKKWQSRLPSEIAVWNWVRCHETFRKDAAHLSRAHIVAYEDLVADPHRICDQISTFLGVTVDPGDNEFRTGINDRYFADWQAGGSWTTSKLARSVLAQALERRLTAWGYSFDDARPSLGSKSES